jgi:hypothetical protein
MLKFFAATLACVDVEALVVGDPGDDDVRGAERLRLGDRAREVVLEVAVGDVGADDLDAIGIGQALSSLAGCL